MSVNCPPPAPPAGCPLSGACAPPVSQPSAKLNSGCVANCNNGNLPFGDASACTKCPAKGSFPESCPVVCNLSPMARLVLAVVQLMNANGSSNSDILAQHNNVTCPEVPLTLAEVNGNVDRGVRYGVFRRTASGGIRVYGFFGSLPSNITLAKELGPWYQLCLGMYCRSGD
jgi:hypothetical protein